MASDQVEQVTLPDGSTVTFKLMSAEDQEAVQAFAKALPEEDLLFLSMDITRSKVVAEWVRNIEAGRTSSLVAYDANGLVGYANVHRNQAPWMRRIGEIRVNIAPAYRSRGLGRILVSRIFDMARQLELKKLVAQMTADQSSARSVFRKLGFVPEALLADFVVDQKGITRDLVMMTYDVDGHTDQAGDALQL